MNIKDDINVVAASIEQYNQFIQPYEDASSIVQVWLDTLNKDFKLKYNHSPIHSIQSRIKNLNSIIEKLNRKKLETNFEYAKNYLTDIAGIRVICYYIQDIYFILDILKKQPNTIIIKETDYIENPKPNGYRSYHIILGVTVYNTTGKEYYPVEIQIRTLAMDFWASMEHQLCYKKDRVDKALFQQELREYSDTLIDMESRMKKFYDNTLSKNSSALAEIRS